MSDFVVNGQNYRAGKLPAMTQLHIARRLAPVMAALAPSLADMKSAGDFSLSNMGAVLEPVAMAVGRLSDEDCEYVLGACLSVVSRKRDGDTGWAPIWNQDAKMLQFQELQLMDMLTIAGHVIVQNLGSFT